MKDLAPITLAVTSPQFLAVNPGVPVNDVAELVALRQGQPGKLSLRARSASAAPRTSRWRCSSRPRASTSRTSPTRARRPAVTDLLGGQVQRGLPRAGQRAASSSRTGKLKADRLDRPEALPRDAERADDDRVGLSRTSWRSPGSASLRRRARRSRSSTATTRRS